MIIKICGIREVETLLCCEKNKVNFFGMVFYKDSPRNIKIDQAVNLQSQSKMLSIKGVGVFVNEYFEDLKDLIKLLSLEYVQLHGNENNEYINKLKTLDVKIIKKISIKNKEDLKEIDNFQNVDYYLFDYKNTKNELPGGNAKSFDWDIIENLKLEKPWFLSGGINIENVSKISKNIKPYGIDLSSGVEKKLGIKDNEIINNLVENIIDA